MEELKILLKKYIVLRDENKDEYYRIKDNYKEFKKFIIDNLGYNLIIRSDFIRLEKLPAISESFMGITEFDNKIDYVILVLLLVFLEDKNKEDQFLLSHITETIASNDLSVKFDWTDYQTRRSLIRVLKFFVKNNIMKITDGDEDNFALDATKEVLFESTGVSKYLVRNFNMDILDMKSKKELFSERAIYGDADKGVLRKNSVYRKLLLSSVIYKNESEEDYEYIRNYRKSIEENFNKYLDWNIHIHKNGTMAILEEKESGFRLFPNGKGISDVILFVVSEIRYRVKNKVLIINEEDISLMNKRDFEQMLIDIKLNKGRGFSKEFRDMSNEKFIYEVTKKMEKFKFIKEEKENIRVFPLCGKITGDYPSDYNVEDSNEN